MPPTLDELQARLFLRAALPLVKVVREDKRFIRLWTKNMKAIVQFEAKGSELATHLIFANDQLEVKPDRHPNPTISFVFKNLKNLNAFFAGRLAPFRIKGLYRLDVILRVLPLLLSLKILMPDVHPADPQERAFKVKLLLFMLPTALSQMNKAGDDELVALTKNSPDRIYQFMIADGPAAYLRMKAGRTKSGQGIYTRRRPFVLFKFPSSESAYQVLVNKIPMIEAVGQGHLLLEGAMEYQKEIGLHMQRLEELLTR